MAWQAEMKDGYWLGKDHPGVYQGVKQALNEDYKYSGFDRGHLNPNGHHAGNKGLNSGGFQEEDQQMETATSQRLTLTKGMNCVRL